MTARMRVVHISTEDISGGAARAAYRLHKGLLARGVDSNMLVKRRRSTCSSVQEAPANPAAEFAWDWIKRGSVEAVRTRLSQTFFSLDGPGYDLTKHPLIRSADILHLHWVAQFQSAGSVAKLASLGKPVVWTLHDQRPFTGGCHYSAGCLGYQQNCAECPQLESSSHRVALAQMQNMAAVMQRYPVTIISPSQWLARCAAASAVCRNATIHTVPYGIETDVFFPVPKAEARKRLGLDPDCFYLLFGADYAFEPRKGLNYLIEALDLCFQNRDFNKDKVILLCFGNMQEDSPLYRFRHRAFGFVNGEDQLRDIYSAADLFILPTLEDNLPNTVLEAMSCGTAVAAFDTGGLPDMIRPGVNGYLAPRANSVELARCIQRAVSNPAECRAMGEEARRAAEQNYTLSIQADNIIGIYQKLLGATKSSPRKNRSHFGCKTAGSISSVLMGEFLANFKNEQWVLRRLPRPVRKKRLKLIARAEKILRKRGTDVLLDSRAMTSLYHNLTGQVNGATNPWTWIKNILRPKQTEQPSN